MSKFSVKSIWQNFKDTDHSFEKKFFGAIALATLVLGFFFLVDKALDFIEFPKKLSADFGKVFPYFFFALIFVGLLSAVLYCRSLDVYEAETTETKKASIINVIIWSIYWGAWSIFCAWLKLKHQPLTLPVHAIIIALVFVPGFVAFLIARQMRLEEIKYEEESKHSLQAVVYDRLVPFTLNLERKYYSGYYGLICLPVYLITLSIGLIIGK